MTEEKRTDEENSDDESDPQPKDVLEKVEAYANAVHRFSTIVAELDWPDHMNLNEDTELCVRMFRDFWRQHQRFQLERERRRSKGPREGFASVTEEKVRDFIQHRFNKRYGFGEVDEPLNVDPENHQPDEEHLDENAKERQRRFQDEWE